MDDATKNDIAKRLKRSNCSFWNNLSQDEREAVITEYYNTMSIENLGITRTLERVENLRKSFGFVLVSLLLGLTGSLFGSFIFEFIPHTPKWFAIITIGFVAAVYLFIRFAEKTFARSLAEDDVLEHLLQIARKKSSNKETEQIAQNHKN